MNRIPCCTTQILVIRRALCFVAILLGTGCWPKATEAATPDTPIGWSAVCAKGVESTPGGGNGKVVTARTAKELAGYASRKEPLTILIEGALTGNGKLGIASNKTLLGVGSSARINKAELSMSRVSNIIIRNLTITDARDGIALRGTHHVWVDHCDLSACGDGLLDITNESDYVTVSWTRFSNHDKTMLINSGTSKPEDMGKLNTTLHHNWWDRSNQRNPRVGYGKVHVFNCLYSNNASYGIGLHSQCLVLAERNFFDRVKNPIKQMYRPDPKDIHHGFCESVGNIFKESSGAQDDEGKSFSVNAYYLYDFALNSAADVPKVVKASAGPAAEFGTLGPLPVPGNGAIVDVRPTLRWTHAPTTTGYKVALGETNPPKAAAESSGQTFEPGELKPETVYYWRVDQVTPKGTVEGQIWRFRTLPKR